MGRTGVINSGLATKEVLEAYYWDKMEAAYEGALAMGTGSTGEGARLFRQIEGEWLTRKVATNVQLEDWLNIEFSEAEVAYTDDLGTIASNSCKEAGQRLGYKNASGILITVLTEEADAPWSPGRSGYFVDKYPYDKICVPRWTTTSSENLHAVVMHEYAHAAVLNLADGHAPRWLNEMIAVTLEGGPDKQVMKGFATGEHPWLKPVDLGVNYLAERNGPTRELVHLAYQQSACIGAYLVDKFGEASFNKLLTSFADNSFIKELAMRATNVNPADEAIKETYGINERQLFDAALGWLKHNA